MFACEDFETFMLIVLNCVIGCFYMVSAEEVHVSIAHNCPRLFETVHTILSMHFVIIYLIKNFGDVDFLGRILWYAGNSTIVKTLIESLPHSGVSW
jgi:hypothetical protein